MDASSVSFRPCLRGLFFLGLGAPLLLSGCLPGGQTSLPPYPGRQPAPQAPLLLPPEPPPQTKQVREEFQRQVLEPALATISGRIAAYEQRLRDWQELGGSQKTLRLSTEEVEQIVSCRNQVADLQDAYKDLQDKLLHEDSVEASRELLFSSLQSFKEKDIVYLEGECPRLYSSLNASDAHPPKADAELHETEDAGSHGHQLVRQEEVDASPPRTEPETQQEQSDSSSLRKKGLELLRQGQEQEARSVFNELLAAARQTGNKKQEIAALQMLADLDFGHRDYSSARKKYEELRRLGVSGDKTSRTLDALESSASRRDELDAYASLLLGCLTYNPDKDGFTVVQQAAEFIRLFPDSPLNDDAEDCSHDIEQQAEQWFASLLEEAERLEPAAALAKLEQVPLDILPLDKQDILREKKESLMPEPSPEQEPASAAPEAAPSSPEQTQQTASPLTAIDPLQETWDKGMAAMQADEHDKAIALFSELRSTSFQAKAEGKIKEAEQQAAEALRKKAAALFQQANNAADPSAKKELLLSSRSLLEDVLRKYPQSGIEDKVKRNLNSVAKELDSSSGGGQ
ncbi:hypothetical protein [Candidatus Electronema sp. TJ]|uniref:hypothetical protein n=1 Tax=Candidatus Electronema sp. TJ TaxID=3401573 RepID=UPI003AA81B51